jgi:hypothetical protein
MLKLLEYLAWLGLLAALFVHGASFSIDVNIRALHVLLFIGSMASAIFGLFSFFPQYTEGDSEGGLSLKDLAWDWVPLWMRAGLGLLCAYLVVGFITQLPGISEWSVLNMTPTMARWSAGVDALFFAAGAALLHGASRLRRHK